MLLNYTYSIFLLYGILLNLQRQKYHEFIVVINK